MQSSVTDRGISLLSHTGFQYLISRHFGTFRIRSTLSLWHGKTMGGVEDPTMYHAETQSGIIGLNVQLIYRKTAFLFSRRAACQHTTARHSRKGKTNNGSRKLLSSLSPKRWRKLFFSTSRHVFLHSRKQKEQWIKNKNNRSKSVLFSHFLICRCETKRVGSYCSTLSGQRKRRRAECVRPLY